MPASRIDWNSLLKRQEAAFAAANERSLDPGQEQAVLREAA